MLRSPPFAAPPRFRFLAQGNPLDIELPARLNAENGLLIPARVNGGTQLWWLLDTGGGTLLYLNPLRAADLGIMPSFRDAAQEARAMLRPISAYGHNRAKWRLRPVARRRL